MAETAPPAALRKEEGIALPLAVLGHVLMVGALVLLKPADPPPPVPDRMEVTITSDIGLTSASPDPMADPAPDKGPELGDMPPPPVPETVAKPEPRPVASPPKPVPTPRAQVQSKPQPQVKPQPKPAAAQPKPAQRPQAQNQRSTVPQRSGTKPGASRFDDAFGAGIPGAKPTGQSATSPAPLTGAVRASLAAEVARQLKRKWQGPNGLEVEKLSTTVEWNLNPDGTLTGAPRVIAHTGVTDANRSQSKRHQEQALKAIKLAAPFNLPAQYYSGWKRLRFTFDWKINQ